MNETNMESVLAYYMSAASPSNTVPLFVWLMDVGKYGYGVLGYHWDEEIFYRVKKVPVARKVPGTNIPIPFTEEEQYVSEKVTGYRGARLFNVRPHNFIWDTNYTLANFQRGEFAGRVIDVVGMHEVYRRADEGLYYNVEKIPSRVSGLTNSGGKGRDVELPGEETPPSDYSFDQPKQTELIEITVLLNPKEWGLEKRDQMEHWVFTIAQREVIISAQPLGLYSNRFPFSVIEQEVDGYSEHPLLQRQADAEQPVRLRPFGVLHEGR
jgi:hypothetical protein